MSVNSKCINALHSNIHITNFDYFATSKKSVEPQTAQRIQVPLKSKVTKSIACVSAIIMNHSNTFKHHWANSLVIRYVYWLNALISRPRSLICNIIWRHKTSITSVREDTQKISCWPSILISKGWCIKHRFSEPLMANICHRFFSLLCHFLSYTNTRH